MHAATATDAGAATAADDAAALFWWCCISDDRYRSIRFVSSSKYYTNKHVSKSNNQTINNSIPFINSVRTMKFVIARIAFLSTVSLLCFIYCFSPFYYILDDDDRLTTFGQSFGRRTILAAASYSNGRSIGRGAMLAAASYYERATNCGGFACCCILFRTDRSISLCCSRRTS